MKKKIIFCVVSIFMLILLNCASVLAEEYVSFNLETENETIETIESNGNLDPTPSFEGTGGIVPNPLKIIGENSMYPIHGDISKLYPFSCVCYIESYWNTEDGKRYGVTGTGTMIGKNTVLTAGHVIYDYKLGRADEVYFSPGKYMNYKPYGRVKVIDFTYNKKLEKLNYADPSTYAYEVYDIAVLHCNNNIGQKCGFESVEYISDSSMKAIPSNQILINGFPKAGIPLIKFDQETNSNSTVKGVMYGSIGYAVDCSGKKILFDTDTESGVSGAGLKVHSMSSKKDVIVGVNTAHPNSDSKQYNIGVHITSDIMTWIKSNLK